MAKNNKLVGATGEELSTKAPEIKAVHPFGSKILVEVFNDEELIVTSLVLHANAKYEGTPQARIVELGPNVPADAGLAVGQRVYWTGKGTSVEDPRAVNERVRAMLEVSNILGLIEE